MTVILGGIPENSLLVRIALAKNRGRGITLSREEVKLVYRWLDSTVESAPVAKGKESQ
jgi:hypothetical protein